MGERPLVSVYLPYYNDNKFLKKAREAILANTYNNFELILLNHATTDNCREIAHSYKDIRIKHIDMPYNLGAGSGILMEKALEIAKGKYFKPLCADDILREDGLRILVDYMENNPQIDFAFGNVEYIDVEGNDLNDNYFNSRPNFSIEYNEIDLIRCYSNFQSFLPYIGSIIKRDILNNIKLNKTFIMMFDMSLWLSILCKGGKVGFCDKLVANYRIHDEQVSSIANRKVAEQKSIYENSVFWQIFLQMKDIDLVKNVFNNDELVKKLTKEQDIPFVVAHALFDRIKPYPYIYLNEIMNDDDKLLYYEKTFGYGIKELRDDCRKIPSVTSTEGQRKLSLFKRYKNRIYSKNPKNLKIPDMTFLFFHRIFNILTFKDILKKQKEKRAQEQKPKEYSL